MEHNPQILFSWQAPLRPYAKRSPNILRFYIAVALLLSAIVLFFGDKILVLPILTLLFIFYVFTVTPPPEITNKITQFGVETAGNTLRWETLSYFYYSKRFRYDILTLVTIPPYHHHSYLVIPTVEIKTKITPLLAEHILYQEEAHKNTTDKMVDAFLRLVPHEEFPTTKESFQTHSAASPSPQKPDPS